MRPSSSSASTMEGSVSVMELKQSAAAVCDVVWIVNSSKLDDPLMVRLLRKLGTTIDIAGNINLGTTANLTDSSSGQDTIAGVISGTGRTIQANDGAAGFSETLHDMPMLEMGADPNPWRTDLLTRPIREMDGWVDVPTGPGLGWEVDESFVRNRASEVRVVMAVN